MNDPGKQSRSIRSFVRREGRLTKAQKFALNNYWDKYGIDYDPSLLDFEKLFQRRAPVIIDIGVGTGESTLQHAKQHPENNYLAIEVHRPGVGQLLNKIEIELLHNIKIIQHDV
ncbi:MAG: tRNA (guanosine(46)-N7)-methyltransferase TrmB, partial [Proteobacteria bacterium]|nr:tRNA (guanosine(46)-N7)-methyltransferase TrmB [Pseudomonadota bacterium]